MLALLCGVLYGVPFIPVQYLQHNVKGISRRCTPNFLALLAAHKFITLTSSIPAFRFTSSQFAFAQGSTSASRNTSASGSLACSTCSSTRSTSAVSRLSTLACCCPASSAVSPAELIIVATCRTRLLADCYFNTYILSIYLASTSIMYNCTVHKVYSYILVCMLLC